MKFKKIILKNIRSYKSQEIIFPEGSFLLSGDVGSGKTSILLAIEYALFGLQPGQKGSLLLRNNSSAGFVSLQFEVAGKHITIERKLKRTLKGVSNESATLIKDGERIESSVTEIKSRIVQLLNYPAEFIKKNNILYRYTVYTPQEQMKQIILEDPETRLNILRHVFGVDKYKQIKDNLSVILNDLKTESKIINADISTLDQDISNLGEKKRNLFAVKQRIVLVEEDLARKRESRLKIESEIQELTKKIDEKRQLEREIEKTLIMLTNKREMISSVIRELQDINSSQKEIKELFNPAEYSSLLREISLKRDLTEKLNNDLIQLASRINSLEDSQKEISEKKERIFILKICPTCLQDVSETHKHNIVNEAESRLAALKNSLSLLIQQRENFLKDLENQRNSLRNLEEKKLELEILRSKTDETKKLSTKAQDLEKKKSLLEKDILILSSHITFLKEKVLLYSPLEIQFRKKEAELKQAFLEERESDISLAELKKEIELINREILYFTAVVQKKERSKKKLMEINELQDWLSSQFLKLIELIERNVLFRLRNEFSSVFRKWFSMLITEGSLDSHIDENFTPLINQGDVEMEYSFLSGGERTAVALAYRLALNQTINSLLSKIKTRGLIILDEPTEGFSETQISKIRDILNELNAEQLIIVSHEQRVEGFVDHILKVVKEGDTSFIDNSVDWSTQSRIVVSENSG